MPLDKNNGALLALGATAVLAVAGAAVKRGSRASVGGMVEIEFVPQEWEDDYANEVDAPGPTTFFVPAKDCEGMKSRTDESDELRYHDNALEWMGEWDGPFEIIIHR